MPYSMMCRASTSETSSLSGSGIFFFSSTGRVGGCAGCGCSSSSSYQEKRLHQLKTPHRDRHRDPRGEHIFRRIPSFTTLTPSYPGMCHASSLHLLLIAQHIIFSFPSTEFRYFFLRLSQGTLYFCLLTESSCPLPPLYNVYYTFIPCPTYSTRFSL